MVENGLTGFERAVARALDELGTELLGRPQKFVGTVADLYDPDSTEVMVLYAHCSGECLRLYAGAVKVGTTDAFEDSARRVELWLHDVRRVVAEDAHSVAWGIARGVAAHLGVALPCDPAGGRAEEDEALKVAADKVRAVLVDKSATEADVVGVLAVVRALPEGVQERVALEAALERRLARLVEEREAEAARKAEEERRRREAEEREKAEAALKRQEELDRLLAEREARRKADAHAGHASGPTPTPKPNNRGVIAAIAVIACVVVAVVLVVSSQPKDQSKGAASSTHTARETAEKSGDGSVSGVEVRKSLSEYSWDELKKISRAMTKANDSTMGFKIAKKYNLVDSDGMLQGDAKDVTLTDGTKTSVRILGFRHDELADGGFSGISFEFADSPVTHLMNAKDTNTGGWESSDMREWLNSEFWALIPDDLRSCIEVTVKRTNNKGYVEKEGDSSAVTATTDRLWLLSMGEVYGKELKYTSGDDFPLDATYDAEGPQYLLYACHRASTSNYGFCKKPGADLSWWLRSPCAPYKIGFHRVGSGGDWFGVNSNRSYGVSPGFCF